MIIKLLVPNDHEIEIAAIYPNASHGRDTSNWKAIYSPFNLELVTVDGSPTTSLRQWEQS